MPLYPGADDSLIPTVYAVGQTPTGLSEGDTAVLFNAESRFVEDASIAVAPKPGLTTGQVLSAELSFNGAPGAFEVDIQEADTDADAFYQTIPGGAISAVSAVNTAKVDLQFKSRFVRGFIKTFANFATVTITLKVTR